MLNTKPIFPLTTNWMQQLCLFPMEFHFTLNTNNKHLQYCYKKIMFLIALRFPDHLPLPSATSSAALPTARPAKKLPHAPSLEEFRSHSDLMVWAMMLFYSLLSVVSQTQELLMIGNLSTKKTENAIWGHYSYSIYEFFYTLKV